VEQGGAQAKEGYLKAVSTLEIRQDALQRLLHDLEAGMPFLFVEQLLVQTATNLPESDRLRVRLAVSGLWRGGR
jgi:general secretion pathway protein M